MLTRPTATGLAWAGAMTAAAALLMAGERPAVAALIGFVAGMSLATSI